MSKKNKKNNIKNTKNNLYKNIYGVDKSIPELKMKDFIYLLSV